MNKIGIVSKLIMRSYVAYTAAHAGQHTNVSRLYIHH